MEEESIVDANNVTADTLSHTSNAQRENSKAAFTSENLDKSNKLVDAVKNLQSITLNIMNQIQRPRVTHKVILHAIWRLLLILSIVMIQLLTLAMVSLNEYY